MEKNIFAATLLAAVAAVGVAVVVTESSVWGANSPQTSRPAVLVELFTSEGCSSCPPADALLESLDRSGAASGVQAIVLSEHVDYWNHIGWNDPFSSPHFSERQRVYADRLHLDGVYTPQMVVDGTAQFVGSDKQMAKEAVSKSARTEKAVIRVFAGAGGTEKMLRVHVEADPLPSALQSAKVQVFLAVALNKASSEVRSGENGGRHLHHVAVVRSLSQIGAINRGQSFANDVSVPLEKQMKPGDLRLVAFIQELGQGLILGAAMHSATP